MRGQGPTGWFGWYANPRDRAPDRRLVADFKPEELQAIFDGIQQQAFATAPIVPLGQYNPATAYRSDIVDRIPATNALFWNVRRG